MMIMMIMMMMMMMMIMITKILATTCFSSFKIFLATYRSRNVILYSSTQTKDLFQFYLKVVKLTISTLLTLTKAPQ